MITVEEKVYQTVDSGIFVEYGGFPAKVVTGANTFSGETVVIWLNDQWRFVNQTAR